MYQNLSVDNTGITYPDAGSVTLDYEGTYYWKVQALDEEGSPLGDPSQTTYFITPIGEIEIILDFGD